MDGGAREGGGSASGAQDTGDVARVEPAGVSLWPVLLGALACVLLMLAAIWGLNAVYDWQVPNRPLPAPEQFPSPRGQTHQSEQLQDLLAVHRQQPPDNEWRDQGRPRLPSPTERRSGWQRRAAHQA